MKTLITKIANNQITLSDALLQSKIITHKINNTIFKKWLKKETEGYKSNDDMLPSYRKIANRMELSLELGGEKQPIPFNLSPEFEDSVNFYQIIESISIVEEEVKKGSRKILYPIEMVQHVFSSLSKKTQAMINLYQMRGAILKLEGEINILSYKNVIDQTKNKLLDILLELDYEFPNIKNEYTMNKENNDKTNNIITNNIYGNNAPINLSTGDNSNQTIVVNENIDYSKIKNLGVDENYIDELKKIISETKNDKSSLFKRVMGWLSSVTSSLSARALYDNIPKLLEHLSSIF
ncbi:AbiTii domain-containing protein [Capnocytophaga leadbetteri]